MITFSGEEPAAQMVLKILSGANEEGKPRWMRVVNAIGFHNITVTDPIARRFRIDPPKIS